MDVKNVSVRLDDGKKLILRVPFKTYVVNGVRAIKPTKEASIVLQSFSNWTLEGSVLDR